MSLTKDNAELLAFDKFKFEKEFELRIKELDIKLREVSLKEKELSQAKVKVTPAQVTIIVALLGIFSTLIATYVQNNGNQQLEKTKFESEIILKVASSNDLDQNKKNLRFLVDAGLISDNLQKINKVLKDTASSLRVTTDKFANSVISFAGHVVNEEGKFLDGVNIRVLGSNFSMVTSNGGNFYLDFAPKESQKRVEFTKDGYDTKSEIVSVNQSDLLIMMHRKLRN